MNEETLIAERVSELEEVMGCVHAVLEAAERTHLEKRARVKLELDVASGRVAWLNKTLNHLQELLEKAVPEWKAAEKRLETAKAKLEEAKAALEVAEARLKAAVEARNARREAARGKDGGEGNAGDGGGGTDDCGVGAAAAAVAACLEKEQACREEKASAEKEAVKWRQTVKILETQVQLFTVRHDEAKEIEKALMMQLGLLDGEGKQHLREARDRILEERLWRYRKILAEKPR